MNKVQLRFVKDAMDQPEKLSEWENNMSIIEGTRMKQVRFIPPLTRNEELMQNRIYALNDALALSSTELIKKQDEIDHLKRAILRIETESMAPGNSFTGKMDVAVDSAASLCK